MTLKPVKKIHQSRIPSIMSSVLIVAGACEMLLLARLVARVLAARPDNPAITVLYMVTAPFVSPFAFLNATQPPFGAVLEFSTLLVALLVPLLALVIWHYASKHHADVSTRGNDAWQASATNLSERTST
ncbi:MAG: YggT family protein [Chloroflexia bacterium]|nr:YggT family protein [Chloroflexia bacterium]